MIDSICEKSGIPIEKALYSLEYFGNTSAAPFRLRWIWGLEKGKYRQATHCYYMDLAGD